MELEETEAISSMTAAGSKPKNGRGRHAANTNEPDEESTSKPEVAPSKTSAKMNRGGRLKTMAASKLNIDKPILTPGMAAEILGLHQRTLRIYEAEGLVVPFRTKTQRRHYSLRDIRKFQFIQYLTRVKGINNLNGVKIILFMLDEMRKFIADPEHYFFPDYQDSL